MPWNETRKSWAAFGFSVIPECRYPALFANLRDGATVAEFVEWFPGVEPWQVEAVLELEMRELESSGIRENSI